jgi:hypothetical protein
VQKEDAGGFTRTEGAVLFSAFALFAGFRGPDSPHDPDGWRHPRLAVAGEGTGSAAKSKNWTLTFLKVIVRRRIRGRSYI